MEGNDANLAEWLMVAITALLVFLGILAWRINKHVMWLTGALESHSTLMLRLEAKRGVKDTPIKVIWWDPNREEAPFDGAHGKEADLDNIHLFFPPKYRTSKGGFWGCVTQWLSTPPKCY